MKLGLLALSAALLLGVVALGAGCDDSSEALTIEEYFAELDGITASVEPQLEEAFLIIPQDGSDEEFLADEANLPLFKEFTAALPPIFGEWVDRLEALDSPSEVEAVHRDLVEAGQAFLAALQEDDEAVSEAETMAEVEALEAPFGTIYGPPGARLDEACFDVMLVAAEHGTTLNLFCGDED